MEYTYVEKDEWYQNIYKDKTEPVSAAKSFAFLHEEPTKQVWIVFHGYAGYPGEMVRPARDLFESGYDVYVPRFPGCGTSGKDFSKVNERDWLSFIENVIDDLKKDYSKINLCGHSLACPLIAMVKDEVINKIVFISPTFTNLSFDEKSIKELKLASILNKPTSVPWQSDNRYHLHYENAPCDDAYLGSQYWSYSYPRQLLAYNTIMETGQECLKGIKNRLLIICPLNDLKLSLPSVNIYCADLDENVKIIRIKNGTHLLMYDIDEKAENEAMKAIVKFAKGR